MKLLLVLGFIVVGANANIISYSSGSCWNRCGEDSVYTCSCAARCSLFFQSTGCCDDYFAYCNVAVGYPIPSSDPTYFPTYHPPETPEHPTYYPPATEAPTYYPPQRCNNPGPIENGYISSDQHFFNIGGTVNYACKTGYQLKPAESRQRVCTSSYFISFLQTPYWTPEEPICEKINPCHGNRCHVQHGSCIGNPGGFGYDCICNPGYTGNGYDCKQVFPCDSMPCDPNANCTNIGTTHFQCDCRLGYTGTGKECTKINPCDGNRCHVHGSCIGNPSGFGYDCICNPGYTGNGYDCKQIFPCDQNPCDPNATCTNVDESRFICKCMPGYGGDGKFCIKPCANHKCHAKATCSPHDDGTYSCNCIDGYEGTGKVCTLIDPCRNYNCPYHSKCHNINGFPICKCNFGYMRGNGQKCIITCPAPELPEHGSYSPAEQSRYILGSNITYTCDIGYKLVGDKIRHCMRSGEFSGFARCREINPCRDYNPCDPNAVCTNIDNLRYTCDCKDDYVGDGKKCRKLRPCEYKPCHDNATCKDVNDTLYTCDCIPGYKGNGLECIRIFPCETNPCHSMADCIDVSYTKYTCNCVQGYRGNGKFCEKIDPCKNHQCSLCGTCIPNADGLGHTCVCNSGYFGDGKNCKKPCDEHSCHPLATCYPHECGNHSCKCNVGYEGSGSFCRPIDPCRLVKCPDHSTCKVISGGPKCICDSGYRPLPGGMCQKIYPCDSEPCGSHTTCINVDEDSFRCDCVQGYFPSGLHSCDITISTTLPPTPPPPSCKGKCGAYSFGSACACDPACINHGNCCHDYAQYCSAYVGR